MDSKNAHDRHARPKPNSFYPPQPNRLLIGFVQWTIRRSIRRKLKVTQLEMTGDGFDRLRAAAGERCLLAPSHSGGFEPHVLMWVAKQLDTYFNFVAALEVFEQSAMNRWCMPRLGCYSILRGAVDRQSFTTTRRLLATGERPLVIFPEGEAIWQNSTLVPFQQGVFQLAFKAYEDARELDPTASLYCVPMAIKYVFTGGMQGQMQASLGRLEAQLSLPVSQAPRDAHERLRRISAAVLSANETAHGIQPPAAATLDDRIQQIKQLVISKLEYQFDITPRAGSTLLDRIRTLFNTVDRIVHEEPAPSPYEQQLATERTRMAQALYDELWRLLQFVAVYDGYVSEAMTVERMMDILSLLENELLGQRRVWGPRKAIVQVGEPIDLRDYYDAYLHDKRETVLQVTLEVENQVRGMLTELGAKTRPPWRRQPKATRRQRTASLRRRDALWPVPKSHSPALRPRADLA